MNPAHQQIHRDFLRFFMTHEAAVQGFIRTLVSRREDVAEILQEVAVVLWEKFAEFDQSRDFRQWAFGIARYKVLAHLRDRSRDRHVFDESLITLIADEATADTSGELRRQALEVCLEKLPPAQREIVLAAYQPKTRIDMLARQRGQTAMSLYKLLHRIRLALLECIDRNCVVEGVS